MSQFFFRSVAFWLVEERSVSQDTDLMLIRYGPLTFRSKKTRRTIFKLKKQSKSWNSLPIDTKDMKISWTDLNGFSVNSEIYFFRPKCEKTSFSLTFKYRKFSAKCLVSKAKDIQWLSQPDNLVPPATQIQKVIIISNFFRN